MSPAHTHTHTQLVGFAATVGAVGESGPTSGQELHDEVKVPLILEAVEHLHHPGAVRLHQDVALRPNVRHLQTERWRSWVREPTPAAPPSSPPSSQRHLFLLQHVSFSKDLHGINVTRVFLLHQAHLKRARTRAGTAGECLESVGAPPQIEALTSPKAPRPMTLRDSKSSSPSLVLFSRRNSVSLRACCERRITFCRSDSESEQSQRALWVTAER